MTGYPGYLPRDPRLPSRRGHDVKTLRADPALPTSTTHGADVKGNRSLRIRSVGHEAVPTNRTSNGDSPDSCFPQLPAGSCRHAAMNHTAANDEANSL